MFQMFIKKRFEKKIFPLGEKRENALEKRPRRHPMLWGPPFFVPEKLTVIISNMLQMFICKIGNFYKKKVLKKKYSLLVKRGKIPLKGAPKASDALGATLFCSRHQRVKINKNKICSW